MAAENIELIHVEDIVIYNDDIEQLIDSICKELNITDLSREKHSRWKYILTCIGETYFKDRSILKQKSNIYNSDNGYKNISPNHCNAYNYDLINSLCDYYIKLSHKYNKVVSKMGFSLFCNIPYETISQWNDEKEYRLNPASKKIFKKLSSNSEDTLLDRGIDSNNVMGIFQAGRRLHNWDMPGVNNSKPEALPLTVEQIKQLGVKAETPAIVQNDDAPDIVSEQ